MAAVLRPAKRPNGREIAAHLRRLIREIRSHWPRVEILLRGDSHYCAPEVLDFCRAQGVDYVLGLAGNPSLRRRTATVEQSTIARVDRNSGTKVRRFKEFLDAAASWSRVERIIARVEAGPQGCDTRFIVTNLTRGSGKALYDKLYCARGQAENHIKAWKCHLAADRTSCTSAAANQLRLFLHAGAYWLTWALRAHCRPARPGAMPSSTPSRPVPADRADQAPQMGGDLAALRTSGRAQHGSHEPAGTVEDDDRLKTVIVVVGVEQPQLLATVHRIERVPPRVQGYPA